MCTWRGNGNGNGKRRTYYPEPVANREAQIAPDQCLRLAWRSFTTIF
jgi:hypothetical protein